MSVDRTKPVDEAASVFEEHDRAMLLGAPGSEVADRLEDVADDVGVSVVYSIHEFEATDEGTPVVLDDFYVNFWPDVHREDDRSRLENALDERLDGDAGLYLRTTPYRLKWLLDQERPLFDQLFDDLNGWRVYAIRVDEATARSIVDRKLDGAAEIPDEYFTRSEWSYDFGTFEDCLRDEESFADVFGDLGEYSSLVPATVISAYRWGEGGELFDERDSLLSTLREMLGDASASKAVEGGPKVLEGPGDFVSKLRDREVWSEVVKQVGKVAGDAPDQLSDLPAGSGATALGGLTSPPVAVAGFLGYWAYATRKEDRKTRETYREEFGSVFGAKVLESSPAQLELVEEEYGMAPRTLARLNRTARGINWQRIDEAYERMEATSEQLDELEAVVESNENELNRLKTALLEHEWRRSPKVYQTLEEFEDELYETPEYVPPDYEFETEGRRVFEKEEEVERRPAENGREKVLQILDRDRPSVVFVYGESGIGKSRLLAEVGREIRQRGEKDVKFVYDPTAVKERPPSLSRDTVIFVDEAGYVEHAKYFLGLASEGRRREANKDVTVQVVAAVRPVYRDRVDSQAVDAVAGGVDERRISIRRLEESDGRELLADLPLSDDAKERIHEVASGNPFLMRLLALAEAEQGGKSKSPEKALEEVIRNRFLGETDVLEDEVTDEQDLQTLLQVIAVLKEFVPDEDWDRVGSFESYNDLSKSPVPRLMQQLTESGYLDKRGPEDKILSATYTHSYDPLAHYLRYRILYRRFEVFERMVESGLEARPLQVTEALLELRKSPLSTFSFFDQEHVGKKTGVLLGEVAEIVLSIDISLEKTLEVETLVGTVRPDVIPHDDLESACRNVTGEVAFPEPIRQLLTVLFHRAIAISHHPSIPLGGAKSEADSLFREARRWLEFLEEVYENHPSDPEIRKELAMGLVNATKYEGEAGNLKQMNEWLSRLKQLADAHPRDTVVLKELAMGLVNATRYEGEENNTDQMRDRLNLLEELVDNYPENTALLEQLAKGLVNAIKYDDNTGELSRMRRRVDYLEDLADKCPGDVIIRELAMALSISSHEEGKERELEWMRERLTRLEELAVDHSDDSVVRENLTMGLVNAINAEGEAGHLDRMLKRLVQLEKLTYAHRENPAVRRNLAQGVHNALMVAIETDSYEKLEEILHIFKEVGTNYEDFGGICRVNSFHESSKYINYHLIIIEESKLWERHTDALVTILPEDRMDALAIEVMQAVKQAFQRGAISEEIYRTVVKYFDDY